MNKRLMMAIVLGVVSVLAGMPIATVAAGLSDTSAALSYSFQVDFVVAEATGLQQQADNGESIDSDALVHLRQHIKYLIANEGVITDQTGHDRLLEALDIVKNLSDQFLTESNTSQSIPADTDATLLESPQTLQVKEKSQQRSSLETYSAYNWSYGYLDQFNIRVVLTNKIS